MTSNNWKMIAETRSYIFWWRSRFLRRRVCLSSLLKTLEHAWHREVIPITWWTKSSMKLNSNKERTLLHKHRKRTISSINCHVWKYSKGKMASNIKPATTKRDIQLKTCLLKQNYKGFCQRDEHTAGVAQVCLPHFTYLGVEVIVLHTSFKATNG